MSNQRPPLRDDEIPSLGAMEGLLPRSPAPRTAPVTPQAPAPAPSPSGAYDPMALLGITNQPPEEDEDAGMLSSFLSGVGVGVLEPLTMVPAVRNGVDLLRQHKGDDLRDKISYGLGWMAGGILPGSLAFKVGSRAARGLGLTLKAGKVMQTAKTAEKAAEAAVELTRMGKFVRGGIAGAVWSVGQDAEGLEDWIQNVGTNAAVFGVGDVAIDAGVRALARVWRTARSPSVTPDLMAATRAATGDGATALEAKMFGRALSVIDDIIEKEAVAAAGTVENIASFSARRNNMILGVEKMALNEVQDGVAKIIPSVGGDAGDIQAVLKGLGSYDFAAITRGDTTDYLVALKGQLDPGLVQQYKDEGFFSGMEVLWKGQKYTVVGGSGTSGKVVGKQIGSEAGARTLIDLSEAHMLPIAHLGGSKTPAVELNLRWSQFVQKYGEFPEGEVETTRGIKGGFRTAFNQFIKDAQIKGPIKNDLLDYFVKRQRDALKTIDPELASTLERVRQSSTANLSRVHPEGRLREMAAMKGFTQDWAPNEKGEWTVVLWNERNGTVQKFADVDAAEQFLKSYSVEPGAFVDVDLPIGEEALNPIKGGVGVQVPHDAANISDFSSSVAFSGLASWRPRIAFFRQFDDILNKLGIHDVSVGSGKNAETVPIRLWSGVKGRGGIYNIDNGQVRVRNEMAGKYAPEGFKPRAWIDEIINMRGGRRDVKNIREEVIDQWMNIFEKPRAEHAALAAKAGLSQGEIATMGRLRDWYTDLFTRFGAGKNPEVMTGDEFVQSILPWVRRMSSTNWAKVADTVLQKEGKKLTAFMKDLLEEGQRYGTIGPKTRDPFNLAARVAREGLFREHVEPHWKETKHMVNTLLRAAHEGKIRESSDVMLAANSMNEYLQMARGGTPEVYEALNVTMTKVFNDLGMSVSKASFDRLINTMVSLNYGAFMGLRLGLPVRNMTQLLVTVLPRVGPGNLAAGIESTFKNPRAAKEKMYRVGVLVESGLPTVADDPTHNRIMSEMVVQGLKEKRSGMTRVVEALMRGGEKATDVSNFMLGGDATIAGKKIPVGLFGKSDELLRTISYFAQENRTIKAINKWRKGDIDLNKFNAESGLTQFGETVTKEFHRRFSANQDDAVEFVSKLMSDDTQYVYRLGAGPALFSSGFGRLFGMYGTWPSWYGEALRQGFAQGTKGDKIKYFGYFAAVHAAFINAAYFTGINLSRWTGLSSFEWAGGPLFDWFKDATTIWAGVQNDGTPTAAREIALSKRGFEDLGPQALNDRFGPLAGAVNVMPGNPGQIGVKDPYRAFEQTVGMFTPGMYFIRDVLKTSASLQDGDYGAAMINAFGLKTATPVGSSWPEPTFKWR